MAQPENAELLVVLGRLGDLEVRLAADANEVAAAQALRYEVFYNEMGAIADEQMKASKRDFDSYDQLCDHVIVIDNSIEPHESRGQVVATYRLLRDEIAREAGGFYTASEFDIAPMLELNKGRKLLELGRSCVLAAYRNKRTVELLWQGTWAYILHHNIEVMFGCASLEGTKPEELAEPLSFLYQNAMAKGAWAVKPLPDLAAQFQPLAPEKIDARHAMRSLPPLIKGYLRLGAKISDGAVVDHQFNTTDVMIMLKVEDINPSYVNYYGADASRYAVPQGKPS